MSDISLSIMVSSFIQVVANSRVSFLLMTEYYSVYVYHLSSLSIVLLTGSLFLYLDYCEQCCNEHRSAECQYVLGVSFINIYS